MGMWVEDTLVNLLLSIHSLYLLMLPSDMFGFVNIGYLGPGYDQGRSPMIACARVVVARPRMKVLPSFSGFLHYLRPQHANIRALVL